MLAKDEDFIGGRARRQLFFDKSTGVQGDRILRIDRQHCGDRAIGRFPLVLLDLMGQSVLEPLQFGLLFCSGGLPGRTAPLQSILEHALPSAAIFLNDFPRENESKRCERARDRSWRRVVEYRIRRIGRGLGGF